MGRMATRSRIIVGAIAVVLGYLVAGVTPALAYQGPPADVVNNPSLWGSTYELATGRSNFVTGFQGKPVEQPIARSFRASGLLTRAQFAAGALGLGVLIGGGINRWFEISCSIGASCTPDPGTYDVVFEAWVPEEDTPVTGAPAGGYIAQMDGNPPNSYCCFAATSGDVFLWPSETFDPTDVYRDAIVAFGTVNDFGQDALIDVNGGDYWAFFAAEEALPVHVGITPEPYISQPVDVTVSVPSDPGTGSGTATAIRAALLSGDADTDVAVAKIIDPAYEGPVPAEYVMPDCEGLTYAGCLSLLQAEGFVGSLISNTLGIDDAILALGAGAVVSTNPEAGTAGVPADDDVTANLNPDPLPLEVQAMAHVNETGAEWITRVCPGCTVTYVEVPAEFGDPARGPESPLRITFPTESGTSTRSVPLPDDALAPNPGRFEPDADVTVAVNPADWPVAAAGGGLLGCEDCPPLNMSPLTSLDLGDKFPFGLFVWIGDIVDEITSASASCDSGSIDKPGGGTQAIQLCSDVWVDTYRDPVFLVMQFIAVIALVVSTARRFMGEDGEVVE